MTKLERLFHQEAARAALERHNGRWAARLSNWHAYGGVGWTPGQIVTPDLRGRFETFLPWREFVGSLRGVGRAYLPDESWIPQLLREASSPSLLEFWEELPAYRGRVAFGPEELLPLFCACADPPRFGTDRGRYPEQLSRLKELDFPRGGRLLDLGCGVGLGTLEAVAALGVSGGVGVTQEPLEAWMGTMRELPHDAVRSRHFIDFKNITASFVAGNALQPEGVDGGPDGFAVILCNGLAGGRFLQREEEGRSLLEALERRLAPGGVVAMANTFHEGRRAAVERLLALAAESGWRIDGTWRNAFLRR